MEDNKFTFDEIRPYRDHEVEKVIDALCDVPYFRGVIARLFPDQSVDDVVDKLRAVRSVKGFQSTFIMPFIARLEKNTTAGCSMDGEDKLSKDKGYIFMSNHRDIIMDSAFLNYKLDQSGFTSTEIAIGSNLLIYSWIVDMVKLNKSFVVKRDLPVRQMMDASSNLSAYIRQRVVSDNTNIWIAQREGRAKDGNDVTQGSLLKMLNLSGKGDLIANFAELNIVPVSITYEYDPCDALKAHQYQLKRDQPDYRKSPNEDLTHMSVGLMGPKGHVHFSVGTPIKDELEQLRGLNKNEQFAALTEIIDKQIYSNYKLYASSYVALDLLEASDRHAHLYSPAEKEAFEAYVAKKIESIQGADFDFVRQQMLQAYANPLINQEKALAK